MGRKAVVCTMSNKKEGEIVLGKNDCCLYNVVCGRKVR